MKVSRDARLTQAFVLEGADLQALVQHLRTWAATFRFEALCADSLTRHFESVEEVLDFENPARREMEVLHIRAYSEDHCTTFSLKLDRDTRSNVYFTVEGEETIASQTNQFVEERLSSMKPWYSLLARTNFIFVLSIIVSALSSGVLIATAFLSPTTATGQSTTARSVVQALLIGVGFGFAPLLLGYLLNRFCSKFFPMGAFALGQGIKRHRDKEFLRSTVIVGFAVSFVASIIAAIFFIKA